VQFALILLLILGTRCHPVELVDIRKKRKDDIDSEDDDLKVLNNNHILAISKNNNGFGPESNRGTSGYDNNAYKDDSVMSEVGEDIRYFNVIYYEDMRLLVIRGPDNRGRNILAIEVTMAYHKGIRGAQSRELINHLEYAL
jgi:hypothetical protein